MAGEGTRTLSEYQTPQRNYLELLPTCYRESWSKTVSLFFPKARVTYLLSLPGKSNVRRSYIFFLLPYRPCFQVLNNTSSR